MRKLETIANMGELDLDVWTAGVLAKYEYSVAEIITAARQEKLTKLAGIWKTREAKIMDAVDRAGFIMHESETSRKIRNLLTAIYRPAPETAEQYEARVEFTEQQKDDLLKILGRSLVATELKTLKLHFGIETAYPMTLKEIRDEFQVSRQRVQQYESHAMMKLRHPVRRQDLMKIFPGWYGFVSIVAIGDKFLGRRVDNIPLEDLPRLARVTYENLKAAQIENVGQLSQYTYQEIMQICGYQSRANNVVKALWGVGRSLKPEPIEN